MMAPIPALFADAKSEASRVNTITGDNRQNTGADQKLEEPCARARAGMSLAGLGCGGHAAPQPQPRRSKRRKHRASPPGGIIRQCKSHRGAQIIKTPRREREREKQRAGA